MIIIMACFVVKNLSGRLRRQKLDIIWIHFRCDCRSTASLGLITYFAYSP